MRSYPHDFIRKWENLDEDLDIEVTRVVIDSDDDDDNIHDDVIFEGPSVSVVFLCLICKCHYCMQINDILYASFIRCSET